MERFERLNGRQKASPKRNREESVAQLAADIDNGLHKAEEQPIYSKRDCNPTQINDDYFVLTRPIKY